MKEMERYIFLIKFVESFIGANVKRLKADVFKTSNAAKKEKFIESRERKKKNTKKKNKKKKKKNTTEILRLKKLE